MNWIKKKLIYLLLKYILDYWKGGNKMFTKFKEFLAGKKTYLVAISTIIGVLISWINGQIELAEMLRLIVEAILVITIRAGISKS